MNKIWSYKEAMETTSACTFHNSSRQLDKITSSQVLLRLRTAAWSVRSARLGFEPNEIGMHYFRTGAAMKMYLVRVLVYTIMLIGRWSSDAFLHYIWKQVEQLSSHVVKQMLTFRSFCMIPELAPQVVLIKDP